MEEDKFDRNFIKRVKDFELQCQSVIDFLETNLNGKENNLKINEALTAAKEVLEEYRKQRRKFKLEPQPLPEGVKLGDECRAKVNHRWVRAQLWSRTATGYHVLLLPDDSTVLVERVKPLRRSSSKNIIINNISKSSETTKPPREVKTQKPQKQDSAIANAQKRSWKEMQQKLSSKK